MANKKSKYELVVIIRPNLPENVRMGIESKLIEFLESDGTSIDKVDNWGKKNLEYNISGYSEGYYILFVFNSDSAKINQLNKEIKLNKDIIRFLIVKR